MGGPLLRRDLNDLLILLEETCRGLGGALCAGAGAAAVMALSAGATNEAVAAMARGIGGTLSFEIERVQGRVQSVEVFTFAVIS